MTMTLHLKNLRNIAEAKLALPSSGEVLLIGGGNRAGKSSICTAIAALLTGDAGLFGRQTETVTVGSAGPEAMVAVTDGKGRVAIHWPKTAVTEAGDTAEMASSRLAVGMDKFGRLSAKDAAKSLGEALGIDPDATEFLAAAKAAGIKPTGKRATELTEMAKAGETFGWDHLAETSASKARDAKAVWSHVTGETFGDKKAIRWTPSAWKRLGLTDEDRADLEKTSRDIGQRQRTATTALERADQHAIETKVRRAQLLVVMDRGHEASQEIEEAKRVVEQRREEVAAARELASPTCECPACKVLLRIVEGQTLERENPSRTKGGGSAADKRALRVAEAGLAGALDRVEKLKAAIADWAKAQQEIVEMGPEADTSAIDEHKLAVKTCQEQFAVFRKVAEAETALEDVTFYGSVAKLAGPTGLRAQRLADRLPSFRDRIAKVATALGIDGLEIGDDLAPTVLGHPYDALCESEQWQVDAAVALAVAVMQPGDLVVLDRADVLEAKRRNKLFATVKQLRVPAVIAMTLPDRKVLPDLAAAKMGRSVWLEAGKLLEDQPTQGKAA